MYCHANPKLDSLMLFIAELPASKVYLFREQSYYGRCIVAFKGHVNELYELSADDRDAFMRDVCNTARAIATVVRPQKINYGAYSDKMPHLHFHLVPKFTHGPDFGSTFVMNPEPVQMLTDEKYNELITKIRSLL